MSLEEYFESLLKRLEESDIGNDGKDANGFFEPTRAMLFQRLNLLRDLHGKPQAKAMVRSAWQYVVEHAPADWLKMDADLKTQIKDMLA